MIVAAIALWAVLGLIVGVLISVAMDMEDLEFASGFKAFLFFLACGPAMWLVYLLTILGYVFVLLFDLVVILLEGFPTLFKKVK